MAALPLVPPSLGTLISFDLPGARHPEQACLLNSLALGRAGLALYSGTAGRIPPGGNDDLIINSVVYYQARMACYRRARFYARGTVPLASNTRPELQQLTWTCRY